MLDIDPFTAGAAYAAYRHGQDRQTEEIVAAMQAAHTTQNPGAGQLDIRVVLDDDGDDPNAPVVNALDFSTVDIPDGFDSYIGQEPMKMQLKVAIAGAKMRGQALPHTLLASGNPGVGKTTMARLLAKSFGVSIIEIVPPFNIYTLVAAAEQLLDGDILFIDEIHLLSQKRRGAEILLKVLEDKVAYMPDGEVVELNDITIVGATTDVDLLPQPVIDRFKLRPYFQTYSLAELGQIVVTFSEKHGALDVIDIDLAIGIAEACRGVPRIIEAFVIAAQNLFAVLGVTPTIAQLLEFMETEPDGLSRHDLHYLTAMLQFFPRTSKNGNEVEYIAGEAVMMAVLRETKQGIIRVERFLLERGFISRENRGRRLTERGIARARQAIAEGKGVPDNG